MDILSLQFALLALLSVLLFYLINPRFRVQYLTLLSCAFVGSYNYWLLGYLIIYVSVNYFIGKRIPVTKNRILFFRAGVIINILQLVLLKYATFAIDPVFQLIKINFQISGISKILVPVGISYFTLQGIGYLVNIKMGWEKPEKNFMNLLLYMIFFPKFLSGPVERSNHFLPQLLSVNPFDGQNVTEGIRIAFIGLFKKIAIANQLAPYVIGTFNDFSSLSGANLWIMFFITPLYLYFDFSGYTDMALGLAKMFGIDLLPNFNRPFLSENVSTFWKRFHMSLSSWFNDYIFRQTSFRRRKWGVYASTYAVFITWILFGIWHGAGWNFMALGFLQAVVINYEYFTKNLRFRLFSKLPVLLRNWTGRFFTYTFYCISLVMFFSHDLKSAFVYISKLLKPLGHLQHDPVSTYPITVLLYIPVLMLIEVIENDYKSSYMKFEKFWLKDKTLNKYLRWSVYAFMLSMIFVVGNKAQQFVYVNF